MRLRTLSIALALAAVWPAGAALADDPLDPEMTPEAIARDRELVRQLNLDQLAYVRERDAGYAEGWRAYARAHRRTIEDTGASDGVEDADVRYARQNADYEAARQRYEDSRSRYEADRRQYEADMAAWREAVSACRAGVREACAG